MATLADIAKQASVSTGTVSRVLNNKMTMPISPATVERIKEIARQLDYQPNAAARALATGKTRTIGLYYRGTTETMFIRILEAVEAKARERGYSLIVGSRLESFTSGSAIDGLIYIGTLDDFPLQSPPSLRKPVVFVAPSWPDAVAMQNLVTWSEFEAGQLAVRYLAGFGHQRIGAIWGDFPNWDPAVPRVAGFRTALAELGLVGAEQFGDADVDPIQRGARQMQRLLDEGRGITAVFARNDYLALGALKTLRQARIEVPEQMSIVHFGNSVLSQAVCPELTSVSHPNAEASVIALEKLIDMSESGAEGFPAISLPITLCERASCASPPPHG